MFQVHTALHVWCSSCLTWSQKNGGVFDRKRHFIT
ncbi:hypothetical protein HNR29_007314 [Rhizobium leguminosarum]|nr:hypothetical protein [Rhizobium leguminosarum]